MSIGMRADNYARAAPSCATLSAMGWPRAAARLAALALLATACSEPKVSLDTGPREYVPSDYPQVLKVWTREQNLVELEALEGKLAVTATFESWDFRWAY